MKDCNFYYTRQLSEEGNLELDYIIISSRWMVAGYLETLLRAYKNSIEVWDEKAIKKQLKQIEKCSINTTIFSYYKNLLKFEHATYLATTLNLKTLLGYSLTDVFFDMKTLAKKGNLSAVCQYLKLETGKIDEEVLKIVEEIEKKENKTPAENAVCAYFHYNDEISVFGSDHIHHISQLINEYIDTTKKCIDYDKRLNRLNFEELEDFQNLQYRLEYYRGRLAIQPYVHYIQKAQEGFFKDFVKDEYMDDLNSFLEVSADENYWLMNFDEMKKIYPFSKSPIDTALDEISYMFDASRKKNDVDASAYYWYNCWQAYKNPKNNREEAMVHLKNVAKIDLSFRDKSQRTRDKYFQQLAKEERSL